MPEAPPARDGALRVLLISTNRERDPSPVFPLGLSVLARPVVEAGHETSLLDLCFADDPVAATRAALDERAPDVVLVSVRNLDNTSWPATRSYVDSVSDVVAVCRDRAVVVLGGSGFSLEPDALLAATGAHLGVVGEGEAVVPRLLEAIASGRSASGLPGVVVAGNGTPEPIRLPAEIGTPDRRLFDVGRYLREGGAANVQTKRGCPFGCIYCTYPLLEGTQIRPRPVADVVAELRTLVDEHGIDYVEFCDDIFNFPPAHAAALCEAMAEARLSLSWSAFVNPATLDARLLDLMVRAGCDAVELGTDSGSPALLAALGKPFTVGDVREAARLCAAAGVATAHYLLFGGPGESETTIADSVALMDELAPDAVIGMVGLRVYRGTALHEIALREGVVAPGQSLLAPVFYPGEPQRSRVAALVAEAAAARRTWVVPGLGINSRPAVLALLRAQMPRGPLWRCFARERRSRPARRRAAPAALTA